MGDKFFVQVLIPEEVILAYELDWDSEKLLLFKVLSFFNRGGNWSCLQILA